MLPTATQLRGRWRAAVGPAVVAGLVAAVVMFRPGEPAAVAQPPRAALPPELQFVPADAAIFIHADVAKLWGGPLGKSLRAADPQAFADLTTKTKALFGLAPENLKSATLFWPKLKDKLDFFFYGVVLVFDRPYDKDKLKTGFSQLMPEGTRQTVHAASDRVAVWLVELDESYAKPRPADKAGPLTPAIREAAAGKHLLVAASTLANLPDEIRGDNMPPAVQPFQSLLRAESITGVVDQDKNLSVEVRVKAATPPRAAEAEKALRLLVELMQGGLAGAEKNLTSGTSPNDPTTKNLLAVLKPVQDGLKGAKLTTDGDVARASVSIPADLPIAAVIQKVRQAAARTKSQNNLKQIGIAILNYHDANNSFPRDITDKNGKPILSWRVAILPYIEQAAVYNQFKMDEPWDSENNKKLSQMVIPVFVSPNALQMTDKDGYGITSYKGVSGPGAAFEAGKKLNFANFPDGLSNTVMVVEAGDPIPWAKPGDYPFDPKKPLPQLASPGMGDLCNMLLGDGSVRTVNTKTVSEKTLKAAFTRAGGEPLGNDW